jgi:hypothetical protein
MNWIITFVTLNRVIHLDANQDGVDDSDFYLESLYPVNIIPHMKMFTHSPVHSIIFNALSNI